MTQAAPVFPVVHSVLDPTALCGEVAAELAAMPCFVVLNKLWCMGFETHVIARNRGQWMVDRGYFDERLAGLRRRADARSKLT